MTSISLIRLRLFVSLLFFLIPALSPFTLYAQAEEFYGPFSSWTNLKDTYLARGDGLTDDTHALQTALNNLGQGPLSPVLYIPKGVYRITSTLTMQSRRGIVLIGEDPENTIIKWDGPAGMKMFQLNGVAYSEYSRLTWDGSSKASTGIAHEWDGRTGTANSGTRHTDEIFRDMAVGLKSGANMDAEFSIRRCRFYNCTSTGISLQGWNALDWWIWDCYFEKCFMGVANNQPTFGAGNFHVYRSIFKNTKNTDISLGSSLFFSLRNNISWNSNAFIIASQFSNTSPLTIQDNLIYTRRDNTMIFLFTKGNTLLVDNSFVMTPPDSGALYTIRLEDSYKTPPSDGILIGNSFSATKYNFSVDAGRHLAGDNRYGVKQKTVPEPMPVPFAPRIAYTIREVNNHMTTDEIQAAIDKAAATPRGLVHLAFGEYLITKTLHIPGGSAVIMYGDGLQTGLVWRGLPGQPVIRVDYPALATLRDLHINAASGGEGIVLRDNDQEGNSVYGEELMAYNGVRSNLWVQGFSHTEFRFENLHHNYCKAGNSVQMDGTNRENASVLKIFGCVSVNNNNCYAVSGKGRLLVYDDWSECGLKVPFVTLRGSGEFTLNGAQLNNVTLPKIPLIDIDSFSGKAVFAEVGYAQAHKTLRFSNPSGTADLLSLGTLLSTDSTLAFYDIQSDPHHFALVNNRYNVGPGSFPLPQKGDTSIAYIEKMLSTMRATTVGAHAQSTRGHTRFTLDRVMIEGGVNNFRVERSDIEKISSH